MGKRFSIAGILVAGAFFASLTGALGKSDPPAEDDPAWTACAKTAAKIEKEFGIPTHLLLAVTLTETGRRGPDRRLTPWPWTVHDGSRGYYMNSREEAIALVQKLREGGRRSVDVGCMQVNLRHHPRAFTSIQDGFDPEQNIRYAAVFLTQLKSVQGSWEKAVARYHSYNPEFYKLYASKVMNHWARQKKRASLTKPAAPVQTAENTASPALKVRPRRAPNRDPQSVVVASNNKKKTTTTQRPAVGGKPAAQ